MQTPVWDGVLNEGAALDAGHGMDNDALGDGVEGSLHDLTDSMPLEAVATLAASGNPQSWPQLADLATRNSHSAIRAEALYGLGEIGGERSAQIIEWVLLNGNLEVRAAAIDALALLEDADSVGPLVRALDDQDPSIRQAASNALEDVREGLRR